MSHPRTARPGWLLDEVASAGRENLDPHHVAHYDAKEDAAAHAEVELLSRLGLGRESTVVDIGAGTGQFTTAVAPRCARVVAVDVSTAMLDLLRSKVGTAGLTNVEVVQAGFLSYEHHGAPADVIYSRYALHHIPDFWKGVALARLHDALRPGGVLRLWDVVYHFEPRDAERRIEQWCSTVDAVGTDDDWRREDLEEHVRDEHSTFTWVLEELIRRAGFMVEQAGYSDDGVFAKYVLRRT